MRQGREEVEGGKGGGGGSGIKVLPCRHDEGEVGGTKTGNKGGMTETRGRMEG